MAKIRYNFSLEEETLQKLKELAEKETRPVSNYLQALINREYDHIDKKAN